MNDHEYQMFCQVLVLMVQIRDALVAPRKFEYMRVHNPSDEEFQGLAAQNWRLVATQAIEGTSMSVYVLEREIRG
jgi:hypothetical protein